MNVKVDSPNVMMVELSEENLGQLRQQIEWHVEDPGNWPRVMIRKTMPNGRIIIVEVTPDER